MRPDGILIVSASTGTGHLRAAEALREAYAQLAPERHVEHVDLLDLAPRWVRSAYGGGYEVITTRTPWLWREIYERTDAPRGDRARWGPLAQRMLFRAFRRELLARRWGLCLCTHFLPGQLAAGTPGAPPFAMVITDLTLHRFWAQPRVHRYFVGTGALGADLAERLPHARIDVTGIPTATRFARAPGRLEARRSLGLDPERPTLLVMGGGCGLGVERAVDAALRAPVPGLQLLVICGRNAGAEARLRALTLTEHRLHVAGFVNDVERYMAAADVVVTKPGGLSTSEVLAVGRPLLLTHPIPGQEERNAEVLCRAGAALGCGDSLDLVRQITRVFRRPGLLATLAARAAAVGRPHAARSIIERLTRDPALGHAA